MALTLEVEQRLGKLGLIQFFEDHRAQIWLPLAQRTYNYVKGDFPENALIRHDDVAKQLKPMVEIHEELIGFLSQKRKSEKYWFGYFADLILDRTWAEIIVPH